MLEVEALTATRFDPDARHVRTIPPGIRKEYEAFAWEHAKKHNYKLAEVYLKFFAEKN